VAQSIIERAKALNPFGGLDKIANPSPAPVSKPARPEPSQPTGPNVPVQWADPTTGKRMSGTPAERDLATKKPAAKPVEKAKSPAAPRAMSKGGR
jgi:hypothetical protein